MRVLKFRVWDKHEKQFIYMGTQFSFTQGKIIHNFWDVSNLDDRYHIMQFTGLFDKNGIEIYEGDILNLENWIEDINASEVRTVEFKNGCFIVKGDNCYCNIDMVNLSLCEVIDNIHKNNEY